jgi:glycosyltransferase involved in cell wall biosynthesis
MAVIEILDVSLTETVSARLRGRYLRAVPGTLNTAHTMEITGWVLGRECPVVAVELVHKCNVCRRAPVNIHSPDAAAIYPGVTEAAYSGFNLNISLLGLTPDVEFLVQAVLKDQDRVPIGVIRARRLWRDGGVDANSPLVSVVIPCYRQAHFLDEAIESVLAQSYPHFELVVVDDGSDDNTAAIAGTYPGVRYIRQKNAGLSAARNTGLRHSLGKYLVFLDADDRLLANALEAGLQCFTSHPECAFVYGHSRFVMFEGSPMRGRPQPVVNVEADYYLALLRGAPIMAPASVMYRREIFELVGAFDPSLSPAADYDLYYRIARQFPIRCHEQTIVEFRRHDTNMTRDYALMLKHNLAAFRAQWRYVRKSAERREAYQAGIRFWKHAQGRLVVKGVRASIGAKEWKRAIQGVWVLLRFCPSYLPLVLGDRPLLQKMRDCIKRAVSKTTSKRPRGGTPLPLVQQIRQAVLAKIPPHANVIVVDKGDGGMLGLDGLQEWHFPPPKEGSPERPVATGQSKGSREVTWMKIGCTYDFRLYSGRGRRKLLAALKVMRTEGAQLTVDLEPVRVADTAGTGTIRWDSGSDSGSELYVSTSPRFTGYYPADSDEAVERLEGLRAKGADFLLFPCTAFWWLDHYQKFREHLDAHYPVVVRDENTCIIFDLRNPPASSVARR